MLAEACYLLANLQRAVDYMLALPAIGKVVVEPVLVGESEYVPSAVAKYWPTMDVADGCVLLLAERFPRAKIITTDIRDFGIYRRQRGQPLNLIQP